MSRYLLVPLLVLTATDTLFPQVYEVVPRDLGVGSGGPINAIETGVFAIEGGTITVVDGEISEWDIRVTGLFSHRFTHEDSLASAEGNVSITDTEISFNYGGPDEESYFMFSSDLREEFDDVAQADARLSWVNSDRSLRYNAGGCGPIPCSEFFVLSGVRIQGISEGPYLIAKAVPEPSGLVTGIVGLGILGALRVRRRTQHSGPPFSCCHMSSNAIEAIS